MGKLLNFITNLFAPADDRIVFFTHYGQKFEEVSKLLGKSRICQQHFANLPTFEDMDLAELAASRAKELFKMIRRPCFLEEASLCIEDTGFPGHEFRCIVGNKKYFRQWAKENQGKKGTIRLCVAFVDAQGVVHNFESSQHGHIVLPKEESGWGKGIGWDPIWAPENYNGRTLGEMLEQKHFVDVRLQLYLTLRELINPNVDGTFEVHLTMAVPETLRIGNCKDGKSAAALQEANAFIAKFKKACEEEHLRALVIFEDHSTDAVNNTQLQLQTAIYRSFPSVSAASNYAYSLSQKFENAYGLRVARTRAEAMARGKLAPTNSGEASKMPKEYYFEFHRRLGVALPAATVSTIQMITERHGTDVAHPHVSTVGPKTFLNCRFMHPCGLEEAMEAWDRLESEIVQATSLEFKKKTLMEYAVLDDNKDFDDDPKSLCCVPRALYESILQDIIDNSSK